MKNIFFALFLAGAGFAQAQVIIGDNIGTAAVKTSVLLEFAKNQNKGLIVPYVRTLPFTPTRGTILLDASNAANARLKFYNGNATTGTAGYVDLSGQPGNVTTVLATQPMGGTEVATSRTVISTNAYNPVGFPEGVVVLNSSTQAMVLPTVSDVQNILKPSPGMMVYVNKQGAKRLAVYNGSKWSFWQAPN